MASGSLAHDQDEYHDPFAQVHVVSSYKSSPMQDMILPAMWVETGKGNGGQ